MPLRKDFAYDKPITYVLDELAAYGRVNGLDDLQATIRNNKIGMILCFQDLQQLSKVYSPVESEVLFTNTATKVVFATGSPRAQRQISEMIGYTTKTKKQVSSSGHINKQTFGAPLMAPADIGRIPDKHVLVIRDKRSPVVLETCDPGKYENFPKNFPPPKGVDKIISKSVYLACDEAKHIQFSQSEAELQIKNFQALAKAAAMAEMEVKAAITHNAEPEVIQDLRIKFSNAKLAFEDFVGRVMSMDDDEEGFGNLLAPSSYGNKPAVLPTNKKTDAQKPKSGKLKNLIEKKVQPKNEAPIDAPDSPAGDDKPASTPKSKAEKLQGLIDAQKKKNS